MKSFIVFYSTLGQSVPALEREEKRREEEVYCRRINVLKKRIKQCRVRDGIEFLNVKQPLIQVQRKYHCIKKHRIDIFDVTITSTCQVSNSH